MSAEVIRPFVRWDVAWTVEHHGIFQMLYYGHHYGWDRNAREQFDIILFLITALSFANDGINLALIQITYGTIDTLPMVRVFSRKHDPEVIQEGLFVINWKSLSISLNNKELLLMIKKMS